MAKLTQAQMRRLCVSENIRLAALHWKSAMLHQQTPPQSLACVEEEVEEDGEDSCRSFAFSTPHPTTRGRFINTYRINIGKRELENYRIYMKCVKACTNRLQKFRKDGLGIWLMTQKEEKAMGKMFTIIFKTSDNWTQPEQVKQGIRGIDPNYLGSNVFFSRESAAAAAAAQGLPGECRIIQVKDLEANLAA
jgi:hypothetical protein